MLELDSGVQPSDLAIGDSEPATKQTSELLNVYLYSYIYIYIYIYKYLYMVVFDGAEYMFNVFGV